MERKWFPVAGSDPGKTPEGELKFKKLDRQQWLVQLVAFFFGFWWNEEREESPLVIPEGRTLSVPTGAPRLPVFIFWLALPRGAKILELNASSTETMMEGSFQIPPILEGYFEGEDPPPPEPDPRIYDSDSWYPPLSEVAEYHLRGTRPLTGVVQIHPFKYQPTSGRLVLRTEVTIDLLCGGVEADGLYSPSEIDYNDVMLPIIVGWEALVRK